MCFISQVLLVDTFAVPPEDLEDDLKIFLRARESLINGNIATNYGGYGNVNDGNTAGYDPDSIKAGEAIKAKARTTAGESRLYALGGKEFRFTSNCVSKASHLQIRNPVPFFSNWRKSGFEMCFAIGSQNLWCWWSQPKQVFNLAHRHSNPIPSTGSGHSRVLSAGQADNGGVYGCRRRIGTHNHVCHCGGCTGVVNSVC